MSVTSNPSQDVAELRRAVGRLAQRLRAERPVDGLSGVKLAVLGHLHRRGASTPSELAAAERYQPQALTRLIAELERDGFLVKTASVADRRKVMLEITLAGRSALAKNMKGRDAWLATALGQLSQVEREVLRIAAPILERLAEFQTNPGAAA